MKINNIKTRKEFYKFSDNWYRRTHRLREVWQNENESIERKLKALKLWEIMKNRVLILTQIAIKINQPKPKNK